MNSPRRILPIGIQSFAKIRTDGFYYVDKTSLALALAKEAGYFFLSRPRRFGKSLFLDTLKELFEGNEALFQGLFIHDKWDWRVRHAVIRISFAGGNVKSVEALEQMIHKQLERHELHFKLPARYPDSRSRFADLIERLHDQNQERQERVVVLVDEHDKPILDNIDDRCMAQTMREVLKDLYSVIKDADAHIRFAFLTGVSKFSKVSLFSGLNNLNDITLDSRYSTICGYTDTDIESVFAPELAGLDRDEIRRWYNGYNWLGESVYNPFDLLFLFDKRKFAPYWFENATPTFLITMLTERREWLPMLGEMETDAELLGSFDVDNISTVALMFQTGYLTIAREEYVDGEYQYLLRFPNQEVYRSLYNNLLGVWTANTEGKVPRKTALRRLLDANDFAGMRELFQTFFAGIPYHWHVNNTIADYEGYYASVFYSYFAALGLEIRVEDASNKGRIDMTVRRGGEIYLFEFKVVELVANGKALQQIKDKGYAEKYRAEGCPIHMIGVEFSRVERNVVGFEVESLCAAFIE